MHISPRSQSPWYHVCQNRTRFFSSVTSAAPYFFSREFSGMLLALHREQPRTDRRKRFARGWRAAMAMKSQKDSSRESVENRREEKDASALATPGNHPENKRERRKCAATGKFPIPQLCMNWWRRAIPEVAHFILLPLLPHLLFTKLKKCTRPPCRRHYAKMRSQSSLELLYPRLFGKTLTQPCLRSSPQTEEGIPSPRRKRATILTRFVA